MTFLGMAENADRFQRLLKEAHIYTLDHVASLDRADCDRLQLPHDLITALQKRHKVWALEMVDDAEKGLEAGEKYYAITPQQVAAANGQNSMPDNQAFKTGFADELTRVQSIGDSASSQQ